MRLAALSLLASFASLAASGAAFAQGPACPQGTQPAVLRISKIKPGQEAMFDKATADQAAWYRGKGLGDAFMAGPSFTRAGLDSATRVTVHSHNVTGRPEGDAGWDKFVQEFKASSDIVTETRACLADVKP